SGAGGAAAAGDISPDTMANALSNNAESGMDELQVFDRMCRSAKVERKVRNRMPHSVEIIESAQ
ncbi:MAG: hypothetical protein ACK50J_10720, partial [Planctomyces sp.]